MLKWNPTRNLGARRPRQVELLRHEQRPDGQPHWLPARCKNQRGIGEDVRFRRDIVSACAGDSGDHPLAPTAPWRFFRSVPGARGSVRFPSVRFERSAVLKLRSKGSPSKPLAAEHVRSSVGIVPRSIYGVFLLCVSAGAAGVTNVVGGARTERSAGSAGCAQVKDRTVA